MKINGGCFCVHIIYEAESVLATVAICNCADCPSHSATAHGVVPLVVDDKFTALTRELKTYVKIAESATWQALTFLSQMRDPHPRSYGGW